MVEFLISLTIILSFLTTFYMLPSWIRRAKNAGLVGKDLNKFSSEKIAEAGGITVIMGFILGVLSYIAIKTFYFKSSDNLIETFALAFTVLLVAFVGMIDDILGWKIGLGKKLRITLILFSAIPLMVINAGSSEIFIPLLGRTNLSILYPLIILPIGIIGATISFNFLAGYNGLETRQGIILLSALAFASWYTGTSWLSVIASCMVASLFAFLLYNKFPAQVFPGDVLTYSIGALIAIMAILGNYETFAIFIFTPYIIETVLKLRGNLEKESFGKPQRDGSIKNKYNKIYGLEHLAIKIIQKFKTKAYEKEVVLLINIFQIILVLIGLWMFIF